MKIRYLLLFPLLLVFNFWASAQKENNVWAFSNWYGLDFNISPPPLIKTRISSFEASASICDASGNLLFYTNGLTVWDNTHTVMPNGLGLIGGMSATQGAAIAPVFGHPNKYYIFSIENFNTGKSGYVRYSMVDMSLNGGKGDVLPGIKNNLLDTGMSEKMIIAPGCNGLWVILHDIDSPVFYSYKIDNPLFIGAPVVSRTTGVAYSGNYYVGEMKLSPNQKTIAVGNYVVEDFDYKGISPVQIFDFNQKTGIISGGLTIDSSNRAYSVEFSPDNKKFYIATWDSSIYQYDISLLPNTAAVYATKYKLNGDNFTSMRRAPDDKIYVVRHNYFTQLSCINNPNVSGVGCNVEVDVPALRNSSSGIYITLGNSTLRPMPGTDTILYSRKDTVICNGDNFYYNADIKRSEIKWHDGSTSRERTFTTAGTFWVSSVMGCTQYIDTINIGLKAKQFNYSSSSYDLCFLKEYVVELKKSALEFLWNDSSKAPTSTFFTSGKKWVISSNRDCNIYVDTFNVKLTNFDVDLRDTFICRDETLIFDAKVDSIATYLWQDNSTGSSLIVKEPGSYWAYVTVGKCSRKDEFIVFQKSFPVNFEADTNICEGASVLLEVMDKNLQYLWQDGSTGSTFLAKEKGTYTVQIKEGNCIVDKQAYVDLVQCENCMHIPNAFTPNNDQINDEFRVLTACLIDKFSIIIYSRFGEQVFSSDNFNLSWDGTFKGLPLNTATFYYMIKVKFRKPGAQEEIYKGDITLIR